MESFERHPDDEVNRALMRLCDCLCMWERSTGRTSALVLREKPEYYFRAASGKPGIPEYISDVDFIYGESGQNNSNIDDSQKNVNQQLKAKISGLANILAKHEEYMEYHWYCDTVTQLQKLSE